MDYEAYLFTVNKNNSYRLDPDELKDVVQDIEIKFLQKSYNDEYKKLTVRDLYRKAVARKIKNEKIVNEGLYAFNEIDSSIDQEITENRLNSICKLNVTDIQKRIVKLLVEGFEYKEIRKKLRISQRCLENHVYQIKKNNSLKSTQVRACSV